MPVLDWIGKQAVVKHHRDVPYRLLESVPELSVPSPIVEGVMKRWRGGCRPGMFNRR